MTAPSRQATISTIIEDITMRINAPLTASARVLKVIKKAPMDSHAYKVRYNNR